MGYRDCSVIAAVLGPEERAPAPGLPGRTGIDLINGSPEPVYRLVVAIVTIQGAGTASTIEGWLEYRERERERFRPDLAPAPLMTASILPSGRYRVWITGVWGRGLGTGGAPRHRSGLYRPCRKPLDSPCHGAARGTRRRPDHPLPRGRTARPGHTRTTPLNCSYASTVANDWPERGKRDLPRQ